MTEQSIPALEEFISQCQSRVNNSLATLLATRAPSNNLRAAMEYACLGGGKRIRPVLVYASALATGEELATADAAACSVELIHSYSLVHDDLPAMDDDDLRRGQATVHKAYDEATAILVGDALQALAFELLSKPQQNIAAENQLRMLNILGCAAGSQGMVGGQALDSEAIGKALTLENLETMHQLKTGALIKASVEMGSLCTGSADPQQLASLASYAEKLGLAFQVQDDILDETGDTATLGKPQGSDRELNKPTYVSLLGIDTARRKASELIEQAIAALNEFPASADPLRELAAYTINRTH